MQRPFAVLFGCSDSRVAAEIIFDRGLGDLFVVRTAGHLVGDEVLASIDYGGRRARRPARRRPQPRQLRRRAAPPSRRTRARVTPPGNLRRIVERLTPEVLAARAAGHHRPPTRSRGSTAGRRPRRPCSSSRRSCASGSRRGTCGIAVLAYRLVDGRTHIVAAHGLEVPPGVR